MWKKSVLAELIDEAVNSCYEYGEGRVEDDRDLDLMVTASWVDCDEPEYESIIHICIYKDGIPVLAYDDPETKCN